jgi:pyruvate dehydrogenase E1 component alpha subunit
VRVRGPLHLSTGQEAVPAGVCINLAREDLITSRTAATATTLAKGASMEKMMCELFGRATGFNGGKGGSMHIADFSVGMLGANGVVAAASRSRWRGARAEGAGRKSTRRLLLRRRRRQPRPVLEGLNWAKIHGSRCCSSARTTAGRRPPRPTR